MDTSGLELAILARGRKLNEMIGDEVPSVFNTNRWIGSVMDWCMGHEDFKIQLFRFIDVLPYLNTDESLISHIQEYFASTGLYSHKGRGDHSGGLCRLQEYHSCLKVPESRPIVLEYQIVKVLHDLKRIPC